MVDQLTNPAVTVSLPRMTYEDFLAWAGDDIRAEWVDGEVIVFMQPNNRHVLLVGFLHDLVSLFVRLRALGQTLGEPFQVLTRGGRAFRRPDLAVFFETPPDVDPASRRRDIPDLVVEVVSDDSEHRDHHDKRTEYAEAGVPEYWIIEGREGRHGVTFLILQPNSSYAEIVRDVEGRLRSRVLPGFWLDPAWLAEDPLPNLAWVLEEVAPGAHADLSQQARQERAAREGRS